MDDAIGMKICPPSHGLTAASLDLGQKFLKAGVRWLPRSAVPVKTSDIDEPAYDESDMDESACDEVPGIGLDVGDCVGFGSGVGR